jgi:hypothetical protein
MSFAFFKSLSQQHAMSWPCTGLQNFHHKNEHLQIPCCLLPTSIAAWWKINAAPRITQSRWMKCQLTAPWKLITILTGFKLFVIFDWILNFLLSWIRTISARNVSAFILFYIRSQCRANKFSVEYIPNIVTHLICHATNGTKNTSRNNLITKKKRM